MQTGGITSDEIQCGLIGLIPVDNGPPGIHHWMNVFYPLEIRL